MPIRKPEIKSGTKMMLGNQRVTILTEPKRNKGKAQIRNQYGYVEDVDPKKLSPIPGQ